MGPETSSAALAGHGRSTGDADARGRELGRKVGTEIRRARLAAGLSQRAVARAAQVTQPRVRHLERGIHKVARLLSFLGLPEPSD
jgi:ribosome-binding protein aMBF1 (putative translation factor)